MIFRLILLVVLCCIWTVRAQAAYQARVVVPAGPFFREEPLALGPDTVQDLARRHGADALTRFLIAPGGIAVMGEGPEARAYIADLFTVREIDLKTGAIRNILPVDGAGLRPSNISIGRSDGQAVLVASGRSSGRVQLIDPRTGTVMREHAGLNAPHDALLLPDGALIVTEAGAGRLVRIEPDDTRTVFADGWRRPVGLVFGQTDTPADTLYVSDAAAGTVDAVDLATGGKRTLAADLAGPEGLALLPDGMPAVRNTGRSTIISLDPKTGARGRIASNVAVGLIPSGLLPTDPQQAAAAGASVFNGLAAGPDGAIYVPSDVQTALFVLKPSAGPKSFMDMLRGLTSGLFR